MQEVFIYLSLIVIIAAVLTIILRAIRQPPIIAYLLTGVIAGPLMLGIITPGTNTSGFIQVFAHLGVALLLFIVGLSLDFRVLKEIGKVAVFAGILEIIATASVSLGIVLSFGFSLKPALYIATALAFSSTVVVVKILSDKKEINTLHGKIALGILIVEDFVASLALMLVPILENQKSNISVLSSVLSIIVLIALVVFVTKYILSRVLEYLARNQEVLFLAGIAWALALAALFYETGFSLEIGALIAGMSLASSKYTLELGSKIKPLRDFFVMLFFVFFGSQLASGISLTLVGEAAIISIFILIGKPLIVMSILRTRGYKKRTNFLTGASLAQISEFSLIMILLGFTLGYVNQEALDLVIMVAFITIAASSYSIYYSHYIFDKLQRFLWIFEGSRGKIKEYDKRTEKTYDVILFGYHRLGYKIGLELKKKKMKFLVVDYNPKVVLSLAREGIDSIYGDASDKELLSEIGIGRAKLIISTVPDESVNIGIKRKLLELDSSSTFIATAEQPREALALYDYGVDYVIIPHHLGGDYVANMISEYDENKIKYSNKGKIHQKELREGKDNSLYI